MIKFKIRSITLAGIIFLLAWISFVPQPIQGTYQHFVMLFLMCLLVISVIRRKSGLKLLLGREDVWLWVFLIGISGGVLFAGNVEIAVRQHFDLSIPLVLLYYLMKLEFKQENWLPVVRSICLFSVLVALFGILECLFHKNPIYEYFLFNPFYERYISYYPRPMSTQMNPAPLGTYLLACLPFSFFLIRKKGTFDRSLGLSCAALNTICILWTFSRGAFLGLIVVFSFYFWKTRKILFLKISIAAFALIILTCSLFKHYLFSRFGVNGLFFGDFYTSILSEYRISRLLTSLRMLKDHPLVGIGLNNFRENFDKYCLVRVYGDEWKIADNMYLTILAETGIIGFLGFMLFIWSMLKRGFYGLTRIKESENKELLTVVLAGLIGLLINMGGYELLYWTTPLYVFCILTGMTAGLTRKNNF